MEKNYNEILTGLRKKLERLISLYESEKYERKQLIKRNSELEDEIRNSLKRAEEAEQKYNTLKLAKSVSGEEKDNAEAKARINKIVREIDNCIALLNR